jgi:hypothetical protein
MITYKYQASQNCWFAGPFVYGQFHSFTFPFSCVQVVRAMADTDLLAQVDVVIRRLDEAREGGATGSTVPRGRAFAIVKLLNEVISFGSREVFTASIEFLRTFPDTASSFNAASVQLQLSVDLTWDAIDGVLVALKEDRELRVPGGRPPTVVSEQGVRVGVALSVVRSPCYVRAPSVVHFCFTPPCACVRALYV